MKYILATSAAVFALGGCSGSEPKGGNQFNDVATAVTLARERPLQTATTPTLRVTRLAECAATLTALARTTPPHQRAARLLEAADRIVSLATRLAGTTGQTAADVTRIRDQTLAAYRQLEQNHPGLYAQSLRQGEQASPTRNPCEGRQQPQLLPDRHLQLTLPDRRACSIPPAAPHPRRMSTVARSDQRSPRPGHLRAVLRGQLPVL